MGWISQNKEIKTYFVVHIYDNSKLCEIEELQRVFETRKEAQDYAEMMCEKTTHGYKIDKFCFGNVDLN